MTSPAIIGAWYLPTRHELELTFHGGRRYRYFGVPEPVARRFSEAMSKGQFFNREIRNRYLCRKFGGELPQVA